MRKCVKVDENNEKRTVATDRDIFPIPTGNLHIWKKKLMYKSTQQLVQCSFWTW